MVGGEAAAGDGEPAAKRSRTAGGAPGQDAPQHSQDAAATKSEPADEAVPPPPPGSPPPEATATDSGAPPPPPSGSPPPDAGSQEVQAALQRISGHISNPKKLGKAVALMQKLMASGSCRREHVGMLLQVVDAALLRPEGIKDPQMRREYRRLFRAVDEQIELFDPSQRRHLDVYRLWGITRGAFMGTDDSFVFNKLVGEVKGLVRGLSETYPDTEDELVALKAKMEELRQNGYASQSPGGKVKLGLDAWDPSEAELMTKEALVACLGTLKECCYANAWARTTVDLALLEACENSQRFCKSHQPILKDFKTFVQEQRAKRKQGPSAKEAKRDTTGFEKARASWSTSKVSHRGNVGGGGDHKTEMWLG